MARNLDDVRLTRRPLDEVPEPVHLFNRTWFILGIGMVLMLVCEAAVIRGVWIHSIQYTMFWAFVAWCVIGVVSKRLERAIEITVDECKSAAETSTSEAREKLRLLRTAYNNFLACTHVDIKQLRKQLRARNGALSAREVEGLVQAEIEKLLKDKYTTFWPWDRGPGSNLKLAATRFHRAIESLQRLEPTIARRDQLESAIEHGRATEQMIRDKDQLDGVISQSLLRINGELKEIPALAQQLYTYRYKWVDIMGNCIGAQFFGLALYIGSTFHAWSRW